MAREVQAMNNGQEILLFGGNANPELAEKIASYLGRPLGQMICTRFSDGEVRVQVLESARGMDVFVVQPTCAPVNDNLMELLVLLDAFRRASARRITAVIPYYGYARQDKKIKPREPITARLVADLITEAGATRVIAVDLHAEQIQGFFDIPVDHLYAGPIIAEYLRTQGYHEQHIVVVSPDVAGVPRARSPCRGTRRADCHHRQATPRTEQGGGDGNHRRGEGAHRDYD
jgi:ribose-phosphate pyrophosphokinase